jgi:hypothetical protein
MRFAKRVVLLFTPWTNIAIENADAEQLLRPENYCRLI